MSPELDISQLNARHRYLEKELTDILAHPAASDEEIAAIKRQKLKLKDEIAALERTKQHAA
jgi:hypothetical protein